MELKLKEVNKRRYCVGCRELVEMTMDKLLGRCPNPNCGRVLYTIDNSKDGK